MTAVGQSVPVAACVIVAALVLIVPRRSGGPASARARIAKLPGAVLAASATAAQWPTSGAVLGVPAGHGDGLPAQPAEVLRPGRADRLLESRSGRLALAALAAAGVWLAVGGIPGLVGGAVAAAGVQSVVRRVCSAPDRTLQARALADLPLAFELLAACLRTGAPPEVAAETAGHSLGGPTGERLIAVAGSLRLGASPVEAWSALADISLAAPAVRSLARCADSGAALATALCRLAEELRAARAAQARALAHRVSVLVVLPLGLCFLPAFLCVGVLPLVAGLLVQVLP